MISVVIPCFNEESVLRELYSRLKEAAQTWGEAYEVILVDDCSKDNSWAIINEIHSQDASWKAVRLSRNFGQQASISAGMKRVTGDCVVILDADLQDPPEFIQNFIKEWKAGYDVVYGIRAKRKEGVIKRFCYSWFYKVLGKLSDTEIPKDSGDYCLMARRVVDILNSIPERNRFVRGLRAWTGFRQKGISYDRDPRFAGKPQYTIVKLTKLAADGIFAFSVAPMRMATYLGLGISLVSCLGALSIFAWRVFSDYELPGYATIIISILFLGGVQLVSIGIIGEYIGRVYDEVKRRPLWIEESTLGFESVTQEIQRCLD
jgi:glycosyltransferase involved in cell wall biosynthesis